MNAHELGQRVYGYLSLTYYRATSLTSEEFREACVALDALEAMATDRTVRSGDPLDCPACGYDPMAPHNGKGDCATDRTSECRDCGCPDRSDEHLREEWTCGCQCHADRTDGRLSP